jgi:hypothetical protein
MKAKKILFVGGPSDGLRREDIAPNHPMIYTLGTPRIEPYYATADPSPEIAVHTEVYTRQQFRDSSGKEHEAMFHSSIKNPMEALLKGYRYHRNPRPRFKRPRSKIRAFFTGMPPYNFDSKLVTICDP